jgi:hypothetical protein
VSHDLNIKTSYSCGTKDPAAVLRYASLLGDRVVSFADAFSLGQNRLDKSEYPGLRYLNGTEWFSRLGGRGFGRVDLLFVGFEMTDQLIAWTSRELRLMRHKWESLPSDMPMERSWENKFEFARLVMVRNLKRAYFDTLPSTEIVMRHFIDAGGKVFLSDMPFTNTFSSKCRMVKQLRDMGLSGIVVFKDESKYLDPATEIQQSLDLCKYSGLLPVIGSGTSQDYFARSIVYGDARGAFDFMTDQLLKLFSAPPLLSKR